jgi:gliding motility-associated-like protein
MRRTLYGSWGTFGVTTQNYIPSDIFEDTVQIKRAVTSGKYGACKSESPYVQIDVIPYIINNLQSRDTAICEGALPKPLTEFAAAGGAGSYSYQWKSKLLNDLTWHDAPGANTLQSYSPPSLTSTTLYRRQVTSQICTSLSKAIIDSVYPKITNNDIIGGSIQYVCYNSSKYLVGSSPSGGNPGVHNYSWWESADNNLWNITSGTKKDYISPALMNATYYRRIVKSGNYDQCIDTSLAVSVRINLLPGGSIPNETDTLCAGDPITIHYSLTGHSPWNLFLGDTDTLHAETAIMTASGEVSFPLSQSANIKILGVVDDSLCQADQNDLSGLVRAKVYEVPDANPGPDDEVCGLIYTLKAIPSKGKGLWTSNNGTIDNSVKDTTGVVAYSYGRGVFRWTETNWHCYDFKDVYITFDEQPKKPYAGKDTTLDYTFEYTLNPGPVEVGSGTWLSLSSGANIENNATVKFDNPGDYLLLWTVENGVCAAESDSLKIKVGDLKVYTGFSPNDDKHNDEFILYLSGRYESELVILDSWGGVVFRTKGTDEVKWDGNNLHGKPVPEGTYYFILTEPNVAERTGYIELRR